MTHTPVLEREPPGITYDRLRLDRLLTRIAHQHGVASALEIPSRGAKAMGGLYSLALARAGADVTLHDPDPHARDAWHRLHLQHRLHTLHAPDLPRLPTADHAFDLAWNFVTLGDAPDRPTLLAEMARSARLVLTVHCNGHNWGYPWHRFLHRLFRVPWNHGDTDWFFPDTVRDAHRAAGLEPLALGYLDMPWWPDPPGFRDMRLHLGLVEENPHTRWTAPIEDIYRGDNIPLPLRVLSRIEDGPVPPPVRTVFSHLFFVLSRSPG
ncbi:MAG: methyltransferase domain-containing protein [Deltaproteobacteria bacterium]|nr:MAG: methyltransferase domain-containing protein [Deltaproteobacteria bacterium]